jgi:hypothetical protein
MEWRNNLSRDQVAHQLGLDRTYAGTDLVLPVLGIFGAGLLVGVGLGLMLAPKSGQELRGDIRHRATDLQNRTTHAIEHTAQNVRARIQRGKESAPSTLAQAENPYAEEGA